MADGHEHCRRVLNYDAWRNVVFCSKCKAEWHEITLAMEPTLPMTAAAGETMEISPLTTMVAGDATVGHVGMPSEPQSYDERNRGMLHAMGRQDLAERLSVAPDKPKRRRKA